MNRLDKNNLIEIRVTAVAKKQRELKQRLERLQTQSRHLLKYLLREKIALRKLAKPMRGWQRNIDVGNVT